VKNRITRRRFLKESALTAAALGAGSVGLAQAPLVKSAPSGLVLRPYLPGNMPAMSFAYLTDDREDPFKAPVQVQQEGIVVPADASHEKFSVNTRWYVHGFGYLWLAADNGGEYYTPGVPAGGPLNLNIELARTRVARNRGVRARYEKLGTIFSADAIHRFNASEELLADALAKKANPERAASLADQALAHAVWGGEKIELEHARGTIERKRRLDKVWFGCETRQFIWAKSEDAIARFVELFNFATVTHYVWDTWYELFEPREGFYNWGIKDNIVNWLSQYDITLEGRPIYWPHPSVTPGWLKSKDFEGVKKYLAKHARDVVSHYGDKVLQWEVVNEMHDWANIHRFAPDQITQLVRLACDTTKEVNPSVVRIINHCCPWADYVARGRQSREEARRPGRSPRQFLHDITEAGVEFDVLGIQIYFPQRDLSDIVRLLERLEKFGKPIYITEIGASSNLHAPTSTGAITGNMDEPFAWHRHWDEELQADWLEQVYTIYYSRQAVKAINWYDLSDFRPFIINGGLIREDASPKQSYHRLKTLLASWNALPKAR
jgi:GH35 family endo-1,4-beta-xylanase